MVEEMGAAAASTSVPPNWPARLMAVLESAHLALVEGDAAGAERIGKAVSALVAAVRDIKALGAETPRESTEENEEELRAELERRLTRFIEADRGEDLLAELAPE